MKLSKVVFVFLIVMGLFFTSTVISRAQYGGPGDPGGDPGTFYCQTNVPVQCIDNCNPGYTTKCTGQYHGVGCSAPTTPTSCISELDSFDGCQTSKEDPTSGSLFPPQLPSPGHTQECPLGDGRTMYCTDDAACKDALYKYDQDKEAEGEDSTKLADFMLCSQAGDQKGKCDDCLKQQGIWTGLGCIPYTPVGMVKKLLPIAVGIAGAAALLTMMFGVFTITTSGGNPENLKKGQEAITAAIVGLLFIIFSMAILQLIGVKILQIPGF